MLNIAQEALFKRSDLFLFTKKLIYLWQATGKTTKKFYYPTFPNFHKIDVYESEGKGYTALKDVLKKKKWDRKSVVDEVKKANIRGRGGAGFNAGLKWSFMPPKKEGVPRYLAVNGDESEPGTHKDRRLFEYILMRL